MEICPVCRASLNSASTCRRCRADLGRVQEIERLGERLTGAAMLSLAVSDITAASRWLRSARAVHVTPEVRALEGLIRCQKARAKT
jgi:hypothetical protein